jgi:hypothetical protein
MSGEPDLLEAARGGDQDAFAQLGRRVPHSTIPPPKLEPRSRAKQELDAARISSGSHCSSSE